MKQNNCFSNFTRYFPKNKQILSLDSFSLSTPFSLFLSCSLSIFRCSCGIININRFNKKKEEKRKILAILSHGDLHVCAGQSKILEEIQTTKANIVLRIRTWQGCKWKDIDALIAKNVTSNPSSKRSDAGQHFQEIRIWERIGEG